MCHHEVDFGVPAEWHYFATSDGKGPCDGVGGTVKRLAARTSLQRPYEQQIITPLDLFSWAKGAMDSIELHYVTTEEVQKNEEFLDERFNSLQTVTGT